MMDLRREGGGVGVARRAKDVGDVAREERDETLDARRRSRVARVLVGGVGVRALAQDAAGERVQEVALGVGAAAEEDDVLQSMRVARVADRLRRNEDRQ